jgi:hypothetical protein
VSYNGCTTDLWLTGSSDDYATAATYNSSSSYTCVFWLERGTYSGGSTTGWTSITGATSISGPSGERDTGTYWDGPGLRVRACLYVWAGPYESATYCTSGI